MSKREAEVLAALARHQSNAEIAAHLFISERTVESHVSSLLRKLGVDDRWALAEIAGSRIGPSGRPGGLPSRLASLAERGPFVGRQAELARLVGRWHEVRSGQRRLAFLAGESGIGKTRLAAELAAVVDADGGVVLCGSCDEESLVPYQPFREALEHHLGARPSAALNSVVARFGPELGRVLPGLPLPAAAPTEATTSPGADRYRLFEAIDALLTAAAASEPMALILDDLDWADRPTLLLLRHLVRHPNRSPLLVLATYRDEEVEPIRPLSQFKAELRRFPGLDEIVLDGLSADDVRVLVRAAPHGGESAGPGLVEALWRETKGNPFLVHELLHHLEVSGELGVPRGVFDLVAERLVRLGGDARYILPVAAVMGESFRLDVLARSLGLDDDRLLDAVEAAARGRFVEEVPEEVDRYRFSHGLVREALYRQLSASRRARLHRSVGENLALLAGDGRTAAEVTYHLGAAGPLVPPEQVVGHALRGAADSMARFAYEAAAALATMALEALRRSGPETGGLRGRVLLTQGDAYRRSGQLEQAQAAFMEAIEAARRASDRVLLAEAALGLGEIAAVWGIDAPLVAVLEEALEGLGDDSGALAARLLARLAQALYYADDHEAQLEMSRRAVDLARRSQNAAALASVLSAHHAALCGPSGLAERLEIADEIVGLADQTGDLELALRGYGWRVHDLIEAGDLVAADAARAEHARLAAELRQPLHERDALAWSAMRAMLEGSFSDAAVAIETSRALSEEINDTHAAAIHDCQRYWLAVEAGGREEHEAAAQMLAKWVAYHQPPAHVYGASLALVCLRLGRLEDAHRELDVLAADSFAGVPRDVVWLDALSDLAEVAAAAGDKARATALLALLTPYADRVVVKDRAMACKGSVSRYLGLLAGVAGHRSQALAHLEAALSVHRRLGSSPLAARTECDLAALLLQGTDPDVVAATRHARSALATAEALGMATLAREATGVLARTERP